MMLDDFFVRAMLAGIGIAVVAGPLGCFVVWRRMAYFGDTLAHASLLGVALALLFNINIMISVLVVSVLVAIMLILIERGKAISSDSILGILSHSTLALGLVTLSFMSWVQIDLMGFLFGDILAVSRQDLALIYGGGALILLVLAMIWRPLFVATINQELAEAEGMKPGTYNMFFVVLLAGIIAIAIKVVGVLLITALLIIPAAAARRLSSSPEQMAVLASMVGAISVVCGLNASLEFDTPSGPSIVVAAMLCFLAAMVIPVAFFQKQSHKQVGKEKNK